jgi:hypothetical protein
MRRLLLSILALSIIGGCLAATWDGTHGPFKVFTFQYQSGGGALPGVPGIGPPAWNTSIWITVTDSAITAVTVQVTTKDAVKTLLIPVINGHTGATFPVRLDEIIGKPELTPHRGGPTVVLGN